MALGGGGAASAAPPDPTVYPVNIAGTEQAGIQADQYGYNLSNADFASRFPGLVAGRTADMKTAYNEMTGPLAPPVENAFVGSGLSKALNAFGSGSPTPDVSATGSTGRGTIASSVAGDTQSYQDSARSYFDTLQSQNPQRAFGLSGGDLLNLQILNQGNRAQANQEAMGIASQVGAAQAQASQARTNAGISAGGTIAGAALSGAIAAGLIS